MGKGGQRQDGGGSKVYTWDEIKKHNGKEDRWVVIEGEVYDVTRWSKKHPGGPRLIGHYAGQDATEAFEAFHHDLPAVKKYLKPIHLGTVADYKTQQICKDFQELKETAVKMGLFNPSYTFYGLVMAHILILDVLAYYILVWYGSGWIPFLASLITYTIVQAQAGWTQHDFGHLSVFKNSKLDHAIHHFILEWIKAQTAWTQHDFGHLSVFKNTKLNHALHHFTMGVLQGASSSWWNHMHYQHHAKPNVIDKDPDVRIEQLFVVGDVMPVQVAQKKEKTMPFNLQHKYFFAIAPLLFPVYFQFMLFQHVITRKLWMELTAILLFYIKFFYLFTPLLGIGWTLVYYFILRCLESHWFVWVAQSNHIPMNIRNDEAYPWVKLQIHATCDIEKSSFNDWFTGHLNFQIEHHLFPTMPRHNLYKIAPLAKSLCEKHGIPYLVKPLGQAFVDIYKSLKSSGELWEETYQQFHSG